MFESKYVVERGIRCGAWAFTNTTRECYAGSIKTVAGDLLNGTTRYTMILENVIQKGDQRPRNKSIDPFETCHGALSIVNLTCTECIEEKSLVARIGPDAVSVSHEVSAFSVVFAHHYLGPALLSSVTTKTRDDK